jgi:hypothetical protein
VYVENIEDGVDVGGLHAEQEIVVWHTTHYIVSPDDVVDPNVKPGTPTTE